MILLLLAIVVISAYLYFVHFADPEKVWREINVKYCTLSKSFLQEILCRLPGRQVVFHEEVLAYYNAYPEEPWYGIKFFTNDTLMIRDPELVQEVTVKSFNHFLDHSEFFNREDVDPFLAKALFMLKGERWHDIRCLLSPAFTGSKMRGMFRLIDECSAKTMNYLGENYKNRSDKSKPLEIEGEDMINKFANDVIASVAFGVEVDSLKDPTNVFYKMAQHLVKMPLWRMFMIQCLPKLAKLFEISNMPSGVTKYFRKIIHDTVTIREDQNIVRPDMLNLLIQAKKGALKYDNEEDSKEFQTSIPSKNIVLDNDDIAAQAVLFFMAGLAGISSLSCFTLYELAINPDIQKKLLTEINESFEENNGKLSYEQVQKMKYLDMVVSESNRKWTIGTFLDRICGIPITLRSGDKEVTIPKGMPIQIPVAGFHNDPKYFPNPDKFDPERFDPMKNTIVPGTYLPFGNGPRNCIGLRFALMESKILVCHILHNFEVVPTAKTPIPLRLKPNAFNTTAKDGFWLGLKPHAM